MIERLRLEESQESLNKCDGPKTLGGRPLHLSRIASLKIAPKGGDPIRGISSAIDLFMIIRLKGSFFQLLSLSLFLTVVLQFLTSQARADWISSIKFSLEENTEVFIGFSENQKDGVFYRKNPGEWVRLTTGPLEEVKFPSNAVISGAVPSRVELTKQDGIKFMEFFTSELFGVINKASPPAMIDRPPGKISRYSWRYWNEGTFLSSIETEKEAVSKIFNVKTNLKMKLGNYYLNSLEGQLIEDNLSFGALSFDLRKLGFIQPTKNEKAAETAETAPTEKQQLSEKTGIESSKIMVRDESGVEKKAWEIIQSFVTDLKKEKLLADEIDESSSLRIRQIFRNLMKKEIGSVKLLGPAGTGKSYLIKLMMKVLREGKAPESLRQHYFFQVDAKALNAGTKFVGSIEARINAMTALSREFPIVWIVDEAHNLRGLGTHSQNSNDVMQALKPGLTEGYFRMIGISTEHEWNSAFANDPALDQRFTEVKVVEPQGEELRKILRSFCKKHSFPEIDDRNLDAIIHLSTKFNAIGAQPRKATLLIEEVFTEQHFEGGLHSPELKEIREAAQRQYNLNPDHFEISQMRKRAVDIPKVLSRFVVGQENAKKEIFNSFLISVAGVEDKNRPKGRKIFAGPPGQGKTELVKAAGEAMNVKVHQIMMTSFTSPIDIQDLKRTIAQALREQAHSILFFDEIEKAHPQIQKDLLGLLNDGYFSIMESKPGGSGESLSVDVSVRNAFVFMATNAGQSYINSLHSSSDYNPQEMREAMINDGMNEFVLDRMEGVIPFFYLNQGQYRKVVVKKIREILENFKANNPERNLVLKNLRGFISKFVKETFREKMSNREAISGLSETLKVKIAQSFLSGENVVELLGIPRISPSQNQCRDLF